MPYQLVHDTKKTVTTGKFYPLGATPDAAGTNFALYSQHAAEAFLLLYDSKDAQEPSDIIRLPNRTKNIFYAHVAGVKPGQLYGYKMRGPYDPRQGLRFNEHKLLIDPYARALSHKFVNRDNLLLAYDINSPDKDLAMDTRGNDALVPKCVVVDDDFDWQGDRQLEIAFEKTIVYETHVKGFTAHPSSDVQNPGTYLGLAEKIPYLQSLGINAVELLPVHEFYVEDFLAQKGMTNYWGYNTVNFFAPEQSYSTGKSPDSAITEFKTMVRELHKAGIEVILDVVYNHTAEGNEHGATVSFKGIDNPSYYCLTGNPREPWRYYMNYTGCGNSVNLGSPVVLRMVLDSMRYWVSVMHVDGFRFDLASVLGREDGMFQRSGAFFDAVSQDPVLCRVKLIAEPWDLSTYQVGNFPLDWSEWNGKFRDNVRRFLKGDDGTIRELGYRLTGSSDLYGDDGRTAYNSINFITCHDGFNLHDLVSYNGKHNDANGEGNRDGSNDNFSWNCGAEGETADKEVLALRFRQMKNAMCYLILSSGTPMILSGDECAQTQKGNNNAYCQDNEISWFDWTRVKGNAEIVDFVRRLIAFRQSHTVFLRRKFFTGADCNLNNIPDLSWYGDNLDSPNWDNHGLHCVSMLIDGTEEGGDYFVFVTFNSDYTLHKVMIPQIAGRKWSRVIDTSIAPPNDFVEKGAAISPQDHYLVNARSIVLLIAR